MSNAIFVIGRILAVLVFIGSGLGHLTDKNMVGYAQFKKIPSAALAVRLSGVLLLAGAAGIVLGIWGDLAAVLSALLVLIMTITMHNFWTLEDAQANHGTASSALALPHPNCSVPRAPFEHRLCPL